LIPSEGRVCPSPAPTTGPSTSISWTIGLVLAVSAWVRLSGVDLGWFMVDQARDVYEGLRIAQGQHFPLVGPVARGLYTLGPLYYYLIALPLWIRPAPEAVVFFLAVLNLGTVYLAYRIGREFFSPTVGLAAAALYGVFPMAVVSTRALWNPGFVPFFVVTFFYALFHFLIGRRAWGLTLAMVALGGLLQVHLSGLVLVILAVAALALFRPAVPWRAFLAGAGMVVALFAPYLVFEAGRGFRGLPDAFRFFQGQGTLAVRESWIEIAWRAIRAPFLLPADMERGFQASPPLTFIRWLQPLELAVFVGAALWLLGHSILRWRRAGTFPKAEGLLLLWLAVPLLTLPHKRALLLWYYFDLLYPAQFLIVGLAIDRTLRAFSSVPRPVSRLARATALLGVGALLMGQIRFLEVLGSEVHASGLLRLPTSIVLRSPDPMWFIKERGYLDLMPLRYKRAVTEALLTETPMGEGDLYRRVHGVAFDNLVEDNGLFYHLIRQQRSAAAASGDEQRPAHWVVLRAADWPAGVTGVRRDVGPYQLVRSSPLIRYDEWRCAPEPSGGWTGRDYDDSRWPRVTLATRGIPDLSAYAIPPLTVWSGRAPGCRGWIDRHEEAVSLVISLQTTPLPEDRVGIGLLALDGHPVRPSRTRSSLTAIHRHTEVRVDLAPSGSAGPTLVAFQVVGETRAFDLDVYAVVVAGAARGTR
jgi:4-amino-4-deoxy-L-arabinose transferase-like glycosyltransferase